MNEDDLNVDDKLKQFFENVEKYVKDDDDRKFVNYVGKSKDYMIESAFNSKQFYNLLNKSSNLTNSNGFYMFLNQITDYIKTHQKPKVKRRIVARNNDDITPQPRPPLPPIANNNQEEENTSSINVENSTNSPKASNQGSSITSNNESNLTAAASNDHEISNQEPKVKERIVAQNNVDITPQPRPPSPHIANNNQEEENTSSINVENSTNSPKASNQGSSITSNNESNLTAAASNDHEISNQEPKVKKRIVAEKIFDITPRPPIANNNLKEDNTSSITSNNESNLTAAATNDHETAVSTTLIQDKSDIIDENSENYSESEENFEGLSESDKRTKVNLYRLQAALCNISKKILELEKQEVDLDSDESAYIIEERYKKHFVKTFKKYRELLRKNSHLVDESFTCNVAKYSCSRKIILPKRITRYPEINIQIEEYFNKKKKDFFPNYIEVLNVITQASKDNGLNLSEERMKKEAKVAFQEIGRLLKTKRLHEEYDVLLSRIDSDEAQVIDPATNDSELNRKLQENKENAKNKINEIIETYVKKQENGEDFSDPEENNDNSDDVDDDKNDDDDDDDGDDDDDDVDDDNEEDKEKVVDDVETSEEVNEATATSSEDSNEPDYPIISVTRALNGYTDSKNESVPITTNGSTNGSLIDKNSLREKSNGPVKRKRLLDIFRKDDDIVASFELDAVDTANNDDSISGSIDKRKRLSTDQTETEQITVANDNKIDNDPLSGIFTEEHKPDGTPQQAIKRETRSMSQKAPNINNKTTDNDDDDIIVLD